MKRRLRFHSRAERDFVRTAQESEREWGKARTRRYLDALEEKLQRIAENPMLGRDAELPREGLRRITSGRHVIFYIVHHDEVEIVRILPDRVDFAAWL